MIKFEDDNDRQLLIQAADICLKAAGVQAINVANRLLLAMQPQVPPAPSPEPVEPSADNS